MRSVFCRLALVALCAALPYRASALDLFADALPQAQNNTCQSYAIMLALAALADPNFPISNFAELREAERRFRSIAETMAGGHYGHDALIAAVARYTANKYALKRETYPDIVSWLTRVRTLTTLSSSTDIMIAQLTGKSFPVILTSVMKFGADFYVGGHIISILGVSGTGVNSKTELVAFNSAIKGGGKINRCEPGTQTGDMRYAAGVGSTNRFELKQFAGMFLIFRLSKN